MFKAFLDGPRHRINTSDIDIDEGFRGGIEFLLVNLEEMPDHTFNGEVYAISDGSDEAHKEFMKAYAMAQRLGLDTLIGDTLILNDEYCL